MRISDKPQAHTQRATESTATESTATESTATESTATNAAQNAGTATRVVDEAATFGRGPQIPGADEHGATASNPSSANGVSPLQTRQFTPKENLFSLVPGRIPNAVGLDVVLKGLSKSPDSKKLVAQVVQTMEAETGVKVPAALVSAASANPERLADILKLSPAQMSAGLQALQQGHAAGSVPQVPDRKRLLPQRFNFKDLGKVEFERPSNPPQEVAPGLYRGGFPNPDVDDASAKNRTVMAEVFDRLADNANLPAGDRFQVEFAGGTFTRTDTFLKKLKEEGYEVSATVEHRVANFAELLTKAPDGSFLDVPAPLMVDVDLGGAGASNKSVEVPSIHSEVVFDIRPPKDAKDPEVPAAKIKWYQGVSATGFFPAEVDQTPAWTGKTVTDTFTGDDATRAFELASLMGDVINQAAKDQGLYASGYGLTGVCNDSVAVLEMALTGRSTSYPLLMQDALLKPELQKRLSDRNHRDDPDYKTLLSAIDALPSDTTPNASALDRALTSIPWAAGQEPFHSSVAAREALEKAGASAL